MSDSLKIPEMNHRKRRAGYIAVHILRALEDYIAPASREEAHHALAQLLLERDAEIITESDRIAAGLPARNENGLSPMQLRILEAARDQALYSVYFRGPMPEMGVTKTTEDGKK